VAKTLLETLGANVVAISRSRSPELIELLEKYKSSLVTVECDVLVRQSFSPPFEICPTQSTRSDEEGLTRAIGLAEKTYRHIDGLILNAAVLDPVGRIDSSDATMTQWRKHFDINFFSLVTALRAALPGLRKSSFGGRVVFVSSGSAVGGTSGWGPYNASKAAMNSLCRYAITMPPSPWMVFLMLISTLATEEPEIVCVAIRPGMVDTDVSFLAIAKHIGPESFFQMQRDVRDNAHVMPAEEAKRFIQAHTEGTLIKPEDPGHVIATLALKAPKSISGQFVTWNQPDLADFRRK
jgi:NAD(P)-dependent dehydrogenase (short-subunit alcohol dehydrogenase family)